MRLLSAAVFATIAWSQIASASEPIVYYSCSAQCEGQTSKNGVFLITTTYGFQGEFLGNGCLDWGTLESCKAKVRELETVGKEK